MISALRDGIAASIIANTSLDSTNLFFDKAPDGISGLYAIYRSVANPQNRDSANRWEEDFVEVSLWGPDLSALETIEAALVTAFEDPTNLTVSGKTVVKSQFDGSPVKGWIIDNWNIKTRFLIEIE